MKKKFNLHTGQKPALEIALLEPVAVGFSITQKDTSQPQEFSGISKTPHLTFCFHFSLKCFVYFAVFECFSSFDVFLSLFLPKPSLAQGRVTAVSIISMQMKSPHSLLPR